MVSMAKFRLANRNSWTSFHYAPAKQNAHEPNLESLKLAGAASTAYRQQHHTKPAKVFEELAKNTE